ncbi:MAG TPA: CoA transferase [Dehalococcoidia bacterium]|nr:CoA transferase [Dehalococcoidia bacterium]
MTQPAAPNPRPPVLPLAGVRVVDFTVAVAGPIASFVLADLGAEVIKVEEPARGRIQRGDMPRREGAADRPWNRMSNFNELNRGKLSLALDVAQPEGRDLFLRLAGVSDIVVENWSPRVVGNLGIDYAQVRHVREDIIYLSMPAFGKTGPYADMRSYGPGIDAMSGLSHLTGYIDGPPLKPGNFYCDQNAGLHAALAAMSALLHRRLTGEGQYIELAMLEGEIQVFGEALLNVALNGREPARLGNRHPSIAPHGVYRCAASRQPAADTGAAGGSDEWVTIVAADDAQWHALCRAMGQEPLTRDPRFAQPLARYQHQDELDAIIGAWTATHNKHEVQRLLQAAGVSAAAALTPEELFADPHIRDRKLFEFVDHPDSGPFPHTRVAFRLSGTPAPIRRSGPPFGEGNDHVLRDLLHLTDNDIERLRAGGVIADPPSSG